MTHPYQQNWMLGSAIAAAHRASLESRGEAVPCSWCRKGEGQDCNCAVDCGHPDCPHALCDDNPFRVVSARVPVPRFG